MTQDGEIDKIQPLGGTMNNCFWGWFPSFDDIVNVAQGVTPAGFSSLSRLTFSHSHSDYIAQGVTPAGSIDD